MVQGGETRGVEDTTTSTMGGADVATDGSRVAFDWSKSNPFGDVQVYAYDVGTGGLDMVSNLNGTNDQPVWLPGDSSCLAFHHAETSSETIYVACQVDGVWSLFNTNLVGAFPVWLD